uniref:Uncharacterized protein n=1 Tax=Siphoviridae sp. ctoMB99 TaxID=2826459 RepID=A0A8S5N038_9CAUD|nr:MAG TPA: hypothetical protein [Siphoviridae sp. ctoMB99]
MFTPFRVFSSLGAPSFAPFSFFSTVGSFS